MARPAHDVFKARRAAGYGRVELSRLLTTVPDDTIERLERSIQALPDLARANELIALLPTMSFASQKALQALVRNAGPLNWTLVLPGTNGNHASTPDTAALSFSAGLDVRIKLTMPDWTPAGFQYLMSKTDSVNQCSWSFGVNANGSFGAMVCPDGVAANRVFVGSVIPGFVDGTTHWLRYHWTDATNVFAELHSDDGVNWTLIQTGSQLSAGIFDSTAAVIVGGQGPGTNSLVATVHYAEVRSSVDGPVVASFNPIGLRNRVTAIRTPATYTATTGEVWTVNGAAWSWVEAF